jgi:serine/threonine protein kinase
VDASLNIPWSERPTVLGVPSFARGKIIPAVDGYSFVEPLGSGTFGEVWLAVHQATGQKVAVKFYTNLANEELVQEMERLREVCGHPNVVTLLDAGRTGDFPYLVMRYYPDSLERHLGPQTSLRQISLWLQQLAEGLVHIHSTNTVHCDLKPSNLLLDEEKRLKVADFGQASRLEREGVWGTLGFMPPEQIASRSSRVAIGWDVYGFGAVAYSLVTGLLPRLHSVSSYRLLQTAASHADQLDLYRKLLFQEMLVPPRRYRPDLDDKLETIILSCLQLEPGLRPSSLSEVSDELKRRREGLPLVHCIRPGMLGCRPHPAVGHDNSEKIALASLYGEWQKARQGRELSTSTELSELGQRMLDKSQFLAAFDLLSLAQGLDSDNPVICQRLSKARLLCGDWYLAREGLLSLRERSPEDAQTLFLLGQSYLQEWKQDRNPTLLETASQLYLQSHQISLSHQNTSEAVTSALHAACVAYVSGRVDKARELAEACLRLCPEAAESEALVTRAFCLLLLGRGLEAKESLQEALNQVDKSLATLRSRTSRFLDFVGLDRDILDEALPSPPVYQVDQSSLRFKELDRETLKELKQEEQLILSTPVQCELDLDLLLSLLLHKPELHLVQPSSTERFLEERVETDALKRDSIRILEEADRTLLSGTDHLPGGQDHTLALSRGLGQLRADSLATSIKVLKPYTGPISEKEETEESVYAYLLVHLGKDRSSTREAFAKTLEPCAVPLCVKERTNGYILIYKSIVEAIFTARALVVSLRRTTPGGEFKFLLDGGPSEFLYDPVLKREIPSGEHLDRLCVMTLPLPSLVVYCTEAAAAWFRSAFERSENTLVYTGEIPNSEGDYFTAIYRVECTSKLDDLPLT